MSREGGGQARAGEGAEPSHAAQGPLPMAQELSAALVASLSEGSFFRARRVYLDDATQLIVYPANDIYLKGSLDAGKPWEELSLRMLLKHALPGSTVVDVGVNFGTFALWLARAVGPEGRLVGFEPQTIMHMTASANMVINNHVNVELHHAAVGHRAGSISMAAVEEDGGRAVDMKQAISKGLPVNYGGLSVGAGGEVIPMLTLDSMGLHNVSIIKIDVEGAEKSVLYGAKETIRSSLPVIMLEAGRKALSDDMRTALELPPEVENWDFEGWAQSLGYVPSGSRRVENNDVWLPPRLAAEAESAGSGDAGSEDSQ